jgi:hypothetical protein
VAYGNGVWVAIAQNSNKAAYSSDGITWTESTLPTTAVWNAIGFGNGNFVAYANDTNIPIRSTDNGVTWANVNPNVATVEIRGLAYGGGIWVATGPSGSFYSTDNGSVWATTSSLGGANDVAYSPSLGMFVAIRATGGIYIAYSFNGSFWTNTITQSILSFVVWGSDKFVAIATNQSYYYTSTSGQSWTPRSLPISEVWASLSYGNGTFVIIAENSTVALVSNDGITWTVKTMPSAVSWTSLAYGDTDNKFVAISGNSTGSATAATIDSSATTSYDIYLPAHGAFSLQLLTWSPLSTNTPTQNAVSLGNAIVALRASYSASYPASGQVNIDTNSSGNISDTVLVTNVGPTSGTLLLSITQGGTASTQDIITVNDPATPGNTYQLSPAINSTLSDIVNVLAYDNNLTNYTMFASGSTSTGSKLTIVAVNNGAVGTLSLPTITVSTAGTSSSLAISRTIRTPGT